MVKRIKKIDSSIISDEKMKELNKKWEMEDDKFFSQMIDFIPKMGAFKTAFLTIIVAVYFNLYSLLGYFILLFLNYIGIFSIEIDMYNHPIQALLKLWFAGLAFKGLGTLLYKKLSPQWDL